MISESILITVLGMGSVFFFLFLLICFMHLLALLSVSDKKSDLAQIALAIAVARHQQKGE